MNYSKFIASRIKDHKSNIVTKMWNIQQKLDDVIAMGRGDTDLDTPCLLYTSPSPRDLSTSRMPSSA